MSCRQKLTARWFGRPWPGAGSPLMMSCWSPAIYWEVLQPAANLPRVQTTSHSCQSVANGRLELVQRVRNSGGSGSLAFPALDATAPQKWEKQWQAAILFQASCEHWDAELWKVGLWTRKGLVEKEERTSWVEWEYPKSMNSSSSWVQLPKSLLHLYSCHT